MRLNISVILSIIFLLSLSRPIIAQQPTFGPVCEEGITCTPTQQPTQPPATSTPKPPPVAGATETTLAFLGFGGILLLAGVSSLFSLRLDRKTA